MIDVPFHNGNLGYYKQWEMECHYTMVMGL